MQLFAMAILDLISHARLPSSVNMLPRYLKTFHILQLFLVYRNCYWGRFCLEILSTFVFFHIYFQATVSNNRRPKNTLDTLRLFTVQIPYSEFYGRNEVPQFLSPKPVNPSACSMTSPARHAARSHSFVYISTS